MTPRPVRAQQYFCGPQYLLRIHTYDNMIVPRTRIPVFCSWTEMLQCAQRHQIRHDFAEQLQVTAWKKTLRKGTVPWPEGD